MFSWPCYPYICFTLNELPGLMTENVRHYVFPEPGDAQIWHLFSTTITALLFHACIRRVARLSARTLLPQRTRIPTNSLLNWIVWKRQVYIVEMTEAIPIIITSEQIFIDTVESIELQQLFSLVCRANELHWYRPESWFRPHKLYVQLDAGNSDRVGKTHKIKGTGTTFEWNKEIPWWVAS